MKRVATNADTMRDATRALLQHLFQRVLLSIRKRIHPSNLPSNGMVVVKPSSRLINSLCPNSGVGFLAGTTGRWFVPGNLVGDGVVVVWPER